MNEETKEKLQKVLNATMTCAYYEEEGSSEHITEYVDWEEIKALMLELGLKPKSFD